MSIRSSLALVAGVVALGSFVACGSSEKPAATPQPEPSTSVSVVAPVDSAAATASASVAPTPPPPPKKVAKDVLMPDGGSVWMFSLADSADAKKSAYDDCAKKGGKDAKKVEACQKDVDKAAADEGLRFEKDDKGAWWFVSFAKDAKGKEILIHKTLFDVASSTDTSVTFTAKGKDSGIKAAPAGKAPTSMTLDVPDENTVSITDADPKKGKLVYKKK
jgi:hypothetical protein